MIELHSITRTVTRKRVFNVSSIHELVTLFEQLLSERHTGSITVHTSQGGLRSVAAEDAAKLPENS